MTKPKSIEIPRLHVAWSSLAGRRDSRAGFVERDLVADRMIVDLGDDRQIAYMCMTRMHASKTTVPNDAKNLTGQVVDLIAKTKREVLVTTSIFETMLDPSE
jgi:hypothetical protein